jgi:hypothetical protein
LDKIVRGSIGKIKAQIFLDSLDQSLAMNRSTGCYLRPRKGSPVAPIIVVALLEQEKYLVLIAENPLETVYPIFGIVSCPLR